MKTNIVRILGIFMTIVALVATGCKNSSEPEARKSHRTVLVYMVAKNDLGTKGFDKDDIALMEAAARRGDTGDGRLLVFHCSADGQQLIEMTKNGPLTLKTYDASTRAVESRRMSEVIADAQSMAPAESYGMVMWSHASGWLEDGIDEGAGGSNGISQQSFGLEDGKKMNITTLAGVLEGRDIDFVYFDCCYMASVEVAYELRHVTDWIVGSVTELPADGMPYELNVECLFRPTAALREAAANTFAKYNALIGEDRTCTISVIRTAGMDKLAAATRDVYAAATNATAPDSYRQQPFMLQSRCYHHDLARYVHGLDAPADKMAAFDDALSETVVYAASTPKLWDKIALNYHCGLSTYIVKHPADATTGNYVNTSWWHDVVTALFKKFTT